MLLYFLIDNKAYRNAILIVMSLFFYAWGEPVWVTILIFSAVVDYFHGLIAEKYRGSWQSKAALASSLIINLSLLGFFKYSGFVFGNINSLFNISIPISKYHLPVGISFYTFQTISYVFDVYRGEVEAQKSPFKLLLFVSLFHQLVAGPIVRYKDIAAEIEHRIITLGGFNEGIKRFIVGLGKKVIIANTAGELAEIFLEGEISGLPVLGAWFGIALFAFQIYFDFSGYSDMAIGLGKMFGFNYRENFNYPYISRSATEFWRRWHISLGSFFRDYLYIPLGGNKKHYARNIFIVWFLTGFWHGAGWNFIVWGLYFGLLIFLEKKLLAKVLEVLPGFVSHAYLIIVALTGWVFFYFTDLSRGIEFLGRMYGFGRVAITNSELHIYAMNNAVFLVIAIIACLPAAGLIRKYIVFLADKSRTAAYITQEIAPFAVNAIILASSIILLVGKTYNPFLYFRF